MYPLDKGKIKKNYDLFFGLQEVVVIPARLAAVKTVEFVINSLLFILIGLNLTSW
jgi:hypothetical protein